MEMAIKLVAVFLMIGLCLTSANARCEDYNDCSSCASHRSFLASCRWCPLTRQCHTYSSLANHCSGKQQVTEPEECVSVAEPQLTYNPYLAELLAMWSGVAYVKPQSSDATSFRAAIQRVIGYDYQLVEFVKNDCETVFQYEDCAAAIGKSAAHKRIIVAFRGSMTGAQVLEQGAQTTIGMRDFPTGGQVLVYYNNAHNALYECVKGVVEELMRQYPGFKIAVTGHSLGGALAQLAAVRLVQQNVVDRYNIDLYTFGSPRIGNRDFAYNYDRIMGNSWRVVNTKDPVPLIVPTDILAIPFAYHTRREVYYTTQPMNPTTPYKLCLGNEDTSCARHGLICLHCIPEHQMYFSDNLPSSINSLVNKGFNPAPKGTREQCDSFRY